MPASPLVTGKLSALLVEHPLVRHLTRRLIWGVYSAENQLLVCFRVAEAQLQHR